MTEQTKKPDVVIEEVKEELFSPLKDCLPEEVCKQLNELCRG